MLLFIVFFPRLSPGHGSTHGWCNHPNCSLNGGQSPHFRDTAEAAEKFLR